MGKSVSNYEDSRWMPPSPHREAILKALRLGRAHLEERGHNRAPLFVYEDGGAMELHLMRVVDGKLVAVAEAALPPTSTRHVDVCGTIDELKKLWAEQPELADTDPGQLRELLEHALRMVRRIEQRLQEYREFTTALQALASRLDALQPPDHAPAPGLHQTMVSIVEQGSSAVRENLDTLFEQAEALRKIAGDSELVLYGYRDGAIEAGQLYEAVRGARDWSQRQTPG